MYFFSDQPTTQKQAGVDLDAIEDSFRLIHEKIILPQKTKTNENLVRITLHLYIIEIRLILINI